MKGMTKFMKNVFSKFCNEEKRREIKETICFRLQDFKYWTIRNRDILVTLVPVAIGGAATIIKVVGKRSNLRKEETIRNLYCYDRSLGHYWRLKRDLSTFEWLEVDRRKANGERLSDILAEMKVLK